MCVPPLDISVEIDLVLTSKSDVCLLVVICTTAEDSALGVAALPLSVIIGCIYGSNGNVVEFLNCILDLKFIGFTVNDKAVTVQLFALSRQLLCYDWLNDNSHLRVLLSHVPLGENILYTVDENELVCVHDGVGVDLVNRNNVYLRKVAG